MQQALTAATLAERLAASAAAGRQIMERTGALFGVAQQAAAVEPLIAGFLAAGPRAVAVCAGGVLDSFDRGWAAAGRG